jgi:L-aspartate oxidase
MWDDAGIVRSTERLDHALDALSDIRREMETEAANGTTDAALIELRNLAQVAWLVVYSARARRESRGLHFNVDYPFRDNERFLHHTVVLRDGAGETPD